MSQLQGNGVASHDQIVPELRAGPNSLAHRSHLWHANFAAPKFRAMSLIAKVGGDAVDAPAAQQYRDPGLPAGAGFSPVPQTPHHPVYAPHATVSVIRQRADSWPSVIAEIQFRRRLPSRCSGLDGEARRHIVTEERDAAIVVAVRRERAMPSIPRSVNVLALIGTARLSGLMASFMQDRDE